MERIAHNEINYYFRKNKYKIISLEALLEEETWEPASACNLSFLKMSNLKSMSQDLDTKLSEIKKLRVDTPQHKQMLKKALLQSGHFKKSTKYRFLRSSSNTGAWLADNLI